MANLNGIPIFTISIESDLEDVTGVEYVSLVADPAIMTNWVAMSNKSSFKKPMKFTVDSDKQMLYGPFLIPDLPIYRYDEVMGEYYVVFTKDIIDQISKKFMKQQYTVNVNYEHQENSQVQSATIVEAWLTGTIDKSQSMGFELSEGSWFGGVHIEDPAFWTQEVKSGNVKGFSIEGFLNMDMKKIKKVKDNMAKIKLDAQAKAKDGTILSTPDKAFAEGSEAYVVDSKGNQTAAPDGDVIMEDGSTLTIKGGKVTAITAATEQAGTPVEFPLTDGTSLFLGITDSEGSITLNVPAFSDAAGTTPAEDGEYAPTTDGNIIITVLKGIVQCIETADSEAADDAGAIPDVSEAMNKIVSAIAAMNKEIKALSVEVKNAPKANDAKIAALETSIKDIATKFSTIPGATTATTKNDKPSIVVEKQKVDMTARITELKKFTSKK